MSRDSVKAFFQILPSCIDEMVYVKGADFMMGSEDKHAYDRESPIHKVNLDDYYMGRFPVTQALWQAVKGIDKNRSYYEGDQRPVETVNWYEAVEFCNKLSKLTGKTPFYDIDKTRKDPGNQNDNDDLKYLVTPIADANGFRLPTEAEWEYAARGGVHQSPFLYAGSDKLREMAWYEDNSHNETRDVGQLLSNALGLYDMSGNVDEWCWDWFRDSYYQDCDRKGTVHKPIGPDQGIGRVIRGGCWGYSPRYCRVAYRFGRFPWYLYRYQGFRLACALQ